MNDSEFCYSDWSGINQPPEGYSNKKKSSLLNLLIDKYKSWIQKKKYFKAKKYPI